MPANNKKNAFFYFVLEMLKKSGSKMDIKDACKDPEISDKWKHMSEHEKAKYKAMEKTAKPNQKKRTGLGEDLSELERERMREKQFADDMREYITNKKGKEYLFLHWELLFQEQLVMLDWHMKIYIIYGLTNTITKQTVGLGNRLQAPELISLRKPLPFLQRYWHRKKFQRLPFAWENQFTVMFKKSKKRPRIECIEEVDEATSPKQPCLHDLNEVETFQDDNPLKMQYEAESLMSASGSTDYCTQQMLLYMYKLDVSTWCYLKRRVENKKLDGVGLTLDNNDVDKFSDIVIRQNDESIHVNVNYTYIVFGI
ncbi:unnamed protein product [Trichogramma brassicae]|uniref:HMG box domain-containing protein n=1 Tax=Trichogramma brassicae TaxID=86971 RepID=A0A6H5J481_9HYME|nr:unnamed protein product [Trichogramma brassicae]